MLRLATTILLASCLGCASIAGGISRAQITALWYDQPAGARSAMVRCAHEVAAERCGHSDTTDQFVKACMQDQVINYRAALDKEKWLRNNGCKGTRPILRGDET